MGLLPRPGFTKPDGPGCPHCYEERGTGSRCGVKRHHHFSNPFLDRLMAGEGPNGSTSLFCELDTPGKSVGLPSIGDMENSEVGHNVLGAFHIFDQGVKPVNNAFRSGEFNSEVWQWLVENCRGEDGNTFHMIGLYSDGNVHAHVNHVFHLIDGAIDNGFKRFRIHPLASGRNVLEKIHSGLL
ncbi:metalloenzyme [Gracilariopsis chorda]|nr:metalloenzyme [Gracilariopsis chorda]